MKLLVIFGVIAQILSVLGVYVPNPDSGKVNLEPLENIFSNHMPQFLEPLNLTTGELKLFAGHSFQLIKAKCPAISQDRLNLINKYITKLISRTNPTPGSSVTFKSLVTSISTCTQHQITDEEKAKRQQSFFQFFFHPLRNFRNLFGLSDVSIKGAADAGKDSSTVAPAPDTIPLDAESAPIQVINLKDTEDKTGSLGLEDDDDDEFAVPSSSASPKNVDVITGGTQDGSDTPLIRIFYSATRNDNNEDPMTSWDPLGWIGGVFRAIRRLFSGMFDAGNDKKEPDALTVDIPQSSVPRVKRDADDATPQPSGKAEAETTEKTIVALKGREAFMVLVDNMCRIYCNECLDQDQIRNYKAAAKELFQLILTDSTGIELASKHFLEPDFLQSLNDC